MSRVLMVYGSAYGQTERITWRIAAVLRGYGCAVDAYRGDQLPEGVPVAGYDACVVAASVLMGHHQSYVRDFVDDHAGTLNALPSAFISVCGAAADAPRQAQEYLDAFLRETGWHPHLARSFAGAVSYTRYPWWLRRYMQWLSRRKGLPTDTTRDWDFTDWSEVDRFAAETAKILAPLPGRKESPVEV
ncbi:MAG TPA: flavodoxin domain-containing protein [Gemmatimonadales bacterium]|nr:flavodoxin domain-containing protein [Gemmatimonadales bacterium]